MEGMKAYLHQGEGVYLGSAVVVIAPDRPEAERMIRDVLDAHGLKHEELDITEFNTDKATVVYTDNGDD